MDWEKLEQDLKELKVLVVGDVALDITGLGDKAGICREDPNQRVFQLDEELYTPGGAGNLAVNVARLAGSTHVIGADGDWNHCPYSRILDRELAMHRIKRTMIHDGRTFVYGKDYYPDGELYGIRYSHSKVLEEGLAEVFRGYIHFWAGKAHCVIVADVAEDGGGLVTPLVWQLLIDRKIPVFGTSRIRAHNIIADHVVLNVHEVNNKGVPYGTSRLITNGEHGATLYDRQYQCGTYIQTAPLDTSTINTCGCGDTTLAVYSLAITAGYSHVISAQLAMAAARSTAKKKFGCGNPTIDEIKREWEEIRYGD